ncbi:unnamed protein product [Diatraea saccharalis]|uniref:BESS domain-containing protein n=1 Tax=Diatraea saccharalis TaxID=40085 RepID=A0A9N9RHL4_9NEOP|nr:unnamed protein product [Diatraea saccharalis]
MLQVLRKNQNQLEEESDLNDVCVSDVETEANVRHNENSCDTDDNTWQESEKASNNVTFIKLLDSDSPLLETRQPTLQTVSDSDEFDTFGRNIAQQLRTLPIPVALETQEILLSVLRKQRLKFLHV